MKLLPHGIADFDRIINDDLYYIDKTRFVPLLEARGSFVLLLRPRRFGKSLFTNMLMSYYDIKKADKFEALFGNLYIGQHPTPLHNTHLVLKLDFSHMSNNGGIDKLDENFSEYCMMKLENFVDYYSAFFTEEEVKKIFRSHHVKHVIEQIVGLCHDKGLQIYLFVDEYDNFTNTVLAARGVEAHHKITHGEGFYRDFFKGCKGTFDRIYMTGVTPVTYDDLTSGFGIADIISLEPQFNQIVGVSETDLREMIEYYRSEGRIQRPTDVIIDELKPWSDNYCFAEKCFNREPTIYNTNMVMSYMREVLGYDETPSVMIDYSARTDYQKLDYLVMSEDGDDCERRVETIREICATGQTTGRIVPQFPASQAGWIENFKSILYYYGTLTYAGSTRRGDAILRVPNKTMGDLYMGYLLNIANHKGFPYNDDMRRRLSDAIGDAAFDGEWQGLVEQIGLCYNQYSGIRNAIKGEHDIQGFVRGLLCLNNFFELWPELELNKGFCDVLLIPRVSSRYAAQHSYILELKYMKADDNDIDSKVEEACHQLNQYVEDIHLTTSGLLNGTPCHLLYLVFRGQEMVKSGIYREIK